jgi:hypothetical protein
MPKRGRNSFKKLDLQRALLATKAVGVPCSIIITDGTMTLVPKAVGEAVAGTNPWDKVSKNAPDKKRTA